MDEPHSSSAAFPCEAESPWWVWQRPAFFRSLSLLPQPSPCSLRTAGCMLPVHYWNTKTTAFSNSNLYTMPTAQSAILTFIQHQHCIQQFWPLYNTNTIFSNSFFFFFFFWRKELQHQHTPTPTHTHTHTIWNKSECQFCETISKHKRLKRDKTKHSQIFSILFNLLWLVHFHLGILNMRGKRWWKTIWRRDQTSPKTTFSKTSLHICKWMNPSPRTTPLLESLLMNF